MARYGRPRTVRPENLASVMKAILAEAREDVKDSIHADIQEFGDTLVKRITAYSQAAYNPNWGRMPKKRTGNYAAGWRLTKLHIPGGVKYVVHNVTEPDLTYLLEHGHIQEGEPGYVRQLPHIRPAFDETAPAFVERVKKRLGGR